MQILNTRYQFSSVKPAKVKNRKKKKKRISSADKHAAQWLFLHSTSDDVN